MRSFGNGSRRNFRSWILRRELRAFALGYDTGDTQAGQLYLFVPFEEAFHPAGEPICEVC